MTSAVVPHTPNAGLVPTGLDQAARLAEMMAQGRLVPQHLQKSPGDCLMVIEQAMRWGMSPFAVAQSTSVIQGKLMFEGKLVAAALQASGILASRLDYVFAGEGKNRSITVSATMRGEKEPRTVEVKIADVATNNQMWTKQPDQQLVYSGTRVWGRRHAPEVMLGVYAPEEFDAQPATTIEHTPAPEQPRRTERPTDYVRLIGAKAERCTTEVHIGGLRRQWIEAITKASDAGRPIAEDVQEKVFQTIQDREAEIANEIEQERAQQSAVDVEEIPA